MPTTPSSSCSVAHRTSPLSQVSAASETLDAGVTVNPVAMALEVLTSPKWLGVDASRIDATSAQNVADAVQADSLSGSAYGRSRGAVSTLYDSQTDARSVLATIAGISDVWLRVNTAGKIEFGRWSRTPNAESMSHLTFADLTEAPSIEIKDASDTPNSYAIEFTDREALHKTAKIVVDDLADRGGGPCPPEQP